jgi:hypothetical protein
MFIAPSYTYLYIYPFLTYVFINPLHIHFTHLLTYIHYTYYGTYYTMYVLYYVRTILGMWDVLSSEYVRQWGLHLRHKNPQDLAVFLAYKARKRRSKLSMRMDDITVTVRIFHIFISLISIFHIISPPAFHIYYHLILFLFLFIFSFFFRDIFIFNPPLPMCIYSPILTIPMCISYSYLYT